MKRLVALGLVVFLPFQSVFANEVTHEIIQVEQEIVFELSENEILDLEEIQESFLVIDNESIGNSGRSWTQPNGFPHMRANIRNTQNQPLTFTLTFANGSRSTQIIPANTTLTTTSNTTPIGLTRADFSTPNGNVTGTITVRVSNLPF